MTTEDGMARRAGSGYAALELRPFDLSRDTVIGILELDLPSDAGKGRVVAMRATPGAREEDWAAHAAAAIAGAWAAEGARVLLVDLFLDEPHLHKLFRARNLEGICDAVEYGASLWRVARPVNDGAFWFVTAGTPAGNPRTLFGQPGWRGFVEGLVAKGVTLMTYQPAESIVHPRAIPSIVLALKGEQMKALGRVGLRDAIALLGPAQVPASTAAAPKVRRNTLGDQIYRSSLWEGFDDEEVASDEGHEEDAPDAAASTRTAPPTPAGLRSGRGRGLSISAFVVLVLFATVMVLLGIHSAGIAEIPEADRLLELYDRLLDWIAGFFQ